MDTNQTITLSINGKQISSPAGLTILEVARKNGIEIPTLCYDPRYKPYGSCLLCVVEVEGMPKLALSCTTEARDGMVVVTDNEKIFDSRRSALEMLLSNHYADCRGPCYINCPAGVDVQGYLSLANEGRYAESLELVMEANPLPSVCSRVCVRYCERGCRRIAIDDEPVGVNFVKRYVSDIEADHMPEPFTAPVNGHKIAIVGSGPAGLTAAFFLAKLGYKVTMFESNKMLGGMLRYGIPNYRLSHEILDRDINYILAHGVEAKTETSLGKDFSLEDLKAQGYKATFVALGAQKAKGMRVEGEDAEGVIGGVEFLKDVVEETQPKLSGHVVVVGGGNTAIDAARTALRWGADKVSVYYRRTRKEMPADIEEIEDALDEGVDIQYLAAPTKVISEGGKLKALRCIRMELGEPDESGRRRPVPVEGSEHDIECSTAIAAIGQDIDLSGLEKSSVESTRWNTIVANDNTLATDMDGVFAGGDAVSGPMAAVDAIGAGRRVARAIDRYVTKGKAEKLQEEFLSKKTNLAELPSDFFEGIPTSQRTHTIKEDPKERINTFEELDHGIDPDTLNSEAGRCLSCGCSAVHTCDLKKYAGEYDVDQKHLAGKVSTFKPDMRHPYITIDNNKCILCGRCVNTCADVLKSSALGFAYRGFETIVMPTMGRALQDTTCISCGNCIESCPTGAIDYNLPFDRPGPWLTAPSYSVCNHCGVGCEVTFNKKDDELWWVGSKYADKYTPGYLCATGRFGHHFIKSDKRISSAMIDGKPVELEAALDKALAGLKAVADKHGPDSIAFLLSPKSTNEELFMAKVLANESFKGSHLASLDRLEAGCACNIASTATLDDIKSAKLIFSIGCDVMAENPVLGFDIKRTVRKGAELLRASASMDETAGFASEHIQIADDKQAAFVNALALAVLEDATNSQAALEGFAEFKASLPKSLDKAAELCGVEVEIIRQLAQKLTDADQKAVLITGDAWHVLAEALSNLALLCGKGFVLTRKHSNSQGLAQLLSSCDLGAAKAAIAAGKIKGLFLLGEDPSVGDEFAKLLDGAEFVVAMDALESGSSKAAAVVLPASAYAESNGSVTAYDGIRRSFKRVFEPVAGKDGFEILSALYEKASGNKAPALNEIEPVKVEARFALYPVTASGKASRRTAFSSIERHAIEVKSELIPTEKA